MSHSHSTIRTLVVAVALSLPAGLSIAAPMSDVVTTRTDQDIHQKFGRDSVYAIQTQQPAQMESRYGSSGSTGMGDFFAGVGAAGAAAWDKVTGLFEPGPSAAAPIESEPHLYGRAGGYVGTDKLALLNRAGPATETSEPVTTGEAISADDLRYPAAREEQLYGSVLAQRAPSPEVGTVRDRELEAVPDAGPAREQESAVMTQAADAGTWTQPDQAGEE